MEVSARLNIRRLRPGEYEIENVKVSLFWQTAELYVRVRKPARRKGRLSRQKLDAPDQEEQAGASTLPLSNYLRQLANVDTRKRESDYVDAMAAAAAFAGVTGGRGLTGGHAGQGAALRLPSGPIPTAEVVPLFDATAAVKTAVASAATSLSARGAPVLSPGVPLPPLSLCPARAG